MKFHWCEEIISNSNGSHRALVEDGKEIANVDCLDREFVKKIIKAHNKAISETAGIWVDKGVEIASQSK